MARRAAQRALDMQCRPGFGGVFADEAGKQDQPAQRHDRPGRRCRPRGIVGVVHRRQHAAIPGQDDGPERDRRKHRQHLAGAKPGLAREGDAKGGQAEKQREGRVVDALQMPALACFELGDAHIGGHVGQRHRAAGKEQGNPEPQCAGGEERQQQRRRNPQPGERQGPAAQRPADPWREPHGDHRADGRGEQRGTQLCIGGGYHRLEVRHQTGKPAPVNSNRAQSEHRCARDPCGVKNRHSRPLFRVSGSVVPQASLCNLQRPPRPQFFAFP